MARRTGRAKPMTAKAGVTKTKRRYAFYKHDRAAK